MLIFEAHNRPKNFANNIMVKYFWYKLLAEK